MFISKCPESHSCMTENKYVSGIKRRNLLKNLGLATGVSTGAIGGLSSTNIASAGGGPKDGGSSIPIDEDQYMSAPSDGGMTDYEWDSTLDEQDEQQYNLVIDQHPNPGALPSTFASPYTMATIYA